MDTKGNIIIQEDVILEKTSEMTLHFTYDNDLKLKELSELLDLSNKAINDFNRKNGILNSKLLGNQYAAKVTSVKEGSIIVEIMLYIAETVGVGLLVNYLYDRLKTWGQTNAQKKKQQNECHSNENILSKYPFTITVNGGEVNIHIHN